MLRALAFVSMRQQQRQATYTAPFHFAGADELVDHNLRAVGEITELRFPNYELIWLRCGVAVFETEHRFF